MHRLHYVPRTLLLWAACLALFFVAPSVQAQEIEPGTVPPDWPGVAPRSAAAPIAKATTPVVKPLQPFFSSSGRLVLSVDGVGTNNPAGATVQVEKPSPTATVQAAFLLSATSFSARLVDGDVTLDGTPAVWLEEVQNNAGGDADFFFSYRADVTSVVKPKVDAAAPGLIDFLVAEPNSGTRGQIDGSVLAVVFDDPSEPDISTVILFFGGQDTNGDSFVIGLADPIDTSAPGFGLEFALGISFGFQPSGQISQIDVNSQRLTSSAGGPDDCDILSLPTNPCSQNGALLTVGGIGDDPANPANPFGGATTSRVDDELYTLDPFVNDGDTNILVETINPSDDDNIFFASLALGATVAIVGEGILLTPVEATNPVNTSHTVTAQLQDDDGIPIAGREVTFAIASGPNAGLGGTATTDANGEATFTWTSTLAGTDVVEARFVDSRDETQTATARKTWEAAQGDSTPPVCGPVTLAPNADGDLEGFFDATDPESGIASVEFTTLINFLGFVDAQTGFVEGDLYTVPGTPETVRIGATQVDPTGGGGLMTLVTNGEGLTSECDPVVQRLSSLVPEQTTLGANFPNPVMGRTTIALSVAEPGPVKVEVFDLLGRKVSTLIDQEMAPGTYEIGWEASETATLAPGTYVYRLTAGETVITRRMTLVR